MPATASLDRTRLARLMDAEMARFEVANPHSRALWERARGSLFEGVPMNWMVKWAGPFPLFVERAAGAHFHDVDGHEYVDFCLGDTGAMAGHGPDATVEPSSASSVAGSPTCCPRKTRSSAATSSAGVSAFRPGSSR